MAIAGMRSLLALPILLLAFRRRHLTWSRPQVAGAIAYAVTVTLFVIANKLTTAANSIVLQYTAPIYVALLSGWLLAEPVRPRDWLTIAATIVGMALFFVDALSVAHLRGNLAAVGAGAAFGIMIVCLRMQKDAGPVASVVLGNVLVALVGLPFLARATPDSAAWPPIILLGTIQIGLAYALYTAAIRRVTALEAILIPAIEPILNPLWVYLAIGETPGRWAIPGGMIVLLAALACGIMRSSSAADAHKA